MWNKVIWFRCIRVDPIENGMKVLIEKCSSVFIITGCSCIIINSRGYGLRFFRRINILKEFEIMSRCITVD